MWYAIIGSIIAVVISGAVYISFRAAHFSFLNRLTGGRRWLGRLIGFALLTAFTGILWLVWGMMNALICVVHLVVIWIICDMIALIAGRFRRRRRRRVYRAGAAAIFITVVYLAVGFFLDHHVFVKHYEFETDKLDGDVRIVQITDSHIGATFHADKFAEYISDINELEPDAVVVTGDFVDDYTTREDMLAGCDALGGVRAKYGVFFVYGNHDKGYFSESSRGWTGAEMEKRLNENGVVILRDEARLIDGRFYIVGRRDRSEGGRGTLRLTASELMSGVDRSKYTVVLDHQPHDFEAEAEAGADLVLCGHTHGGQFIPINYVGEWIGENDLRYGHEKRQNTDFIVSSGISNWAFKFKTGCNSEYVVIDIKGK